MFRFQPTRRADALGRIRSTAVKTVLAASVASAAVLSGSSALAQQAATASALAGPAAPAADVIRLGAAPPRVVGAPRDSGQPADGATSSAAKAKAAVGVDADAVVTTPYTADAIDKSIGTNPIARLWNYERAELGQSSAPAGPANAPPSIRDGWPVIPQSTPPMPFTDWPYGGTTAIGDNRTASVDSPLMVAIQHTPIGQAMNATGIQLYGWVDYGGNLSSSRNKGGNAPAAYDYNPNNIQLDQAVLYLERTPDTVQTDHVDWGFRLSAIYGENYRYTTAYGLASYQYLNHNDFVGYDFPMVYGELWIPQALQGLMIRVGRYISLPDIEAQLAPNNYMYTHSITYTLDNYTNEGVQTTLAITKQFMLQFGVSVGTEAAVWNEGVRLPNLLPNTPANALIESNALGYAVANANPLYSGSTYLKDPGAQPTLTACARFQSQNGKNDLNICANGINHGQWGYNNLQWYGLTAYHTFNAHWHISFEAYEEHEDGVPNELNPQANYIFNHGGTPFSSPYIPTDNGPYLAQCKSATVLRCQTDSFGAVFYLNYSHDALNNISLRGEYYDDPEGQRTGVAAVYHDIGIGWQHWLSPQIELRPEFTYYMSSRPAFDIGVGYPDAPRNYERVLSGDIIVHF